ncbi:MULTISPECIES: GNAT family N-acetyltransferase [Kamptonema]|uniref:GNAT family N-acetyltransferase n=1 Tax=Kamptonema TaxID=1501433 RepID=UPI0001DAD4C4|nr:MULTISPECIES: GNAT family N-acetyltransferase [Kamptonema]CBN57144.1 GCN5-related N-acetyltransferase [Kamptonema sp. PCC 6506]
MTNSFKYSIRPLTQEDEPFLWQMLYEAAHLAEEGESTVEAVRNHPLIAKYVKNWGRKNDFGFLAWELTNHQPVGAVWARLFTGEKQGLGYIDDVTPELAIAVLPQHRGKGIGRQLLVSLLAAAKLSYPSISLSVRSSNLDAIHLYKELGFAMIEGSETINRVGGISFTMKLSFC